MSTSWTVRLFLLGMLLFAPISNAVVAASPLSAGVQPPGTEQVAISGPHQFLSQASTSSSPALPAAPTGCEVSTRNGYEYWICMPERVGVAWDNDVIVYAHGYVGPDQPSQPTPHVPEAELLSEFGGQPVWLPDIVNGAFNQFGLNYHYAFVTTSYSANGLAVEEGLADLLDLVTYFRQGHQDTRNVYLLGRDEGALVTALSIERQPASVFSGGLAICGPIGDLNMQANYVGDFRVVFEYYFPGLLPSDTTPITVPTQYISQNWFNDYYSTNILPAIQLPASAEKLAQLFNVVGAPPYAAQTYSDTVRSLLYYSFLGVEDAKLKLGGQPYDNHNRSYAGSGSSAVDAQINAWVDQKGWRFTASPIALANIADKLQTTGILRSPLVTVHNTLDPLVPYSHERLYFQKVLRNDTLSRLDQFAVNTFGHCTIDPATFLTALTTLVDRVTNPRPPQPSAHAYLPMLKR